MSWGLELKKVIEALKEYTQLATQDIEAACRNLAILAQQFQANKQCICWLSQSQAWRTTKQPRTLNHYCNQKQENIHLLLKSPISKLIGFFKRHPAKHRAEIDHDWTVFLTSPRKFKWSLTSLLHKLNWLYA